MGLMYLEPLMPGTNHPEMVEVPDLCVRLRFPTLKQVEDSEVINLDPEVAEWCADHLGPVVLETVLSRIIVPSQTEGREPKVVRPYQIKVLRFNSNGAAIAFRLRWM